jgi:hypothetical protein
MTRLPGRPSRSVRLFQQSGDSTPKIEHVRVSRDVVALALLAQEGRAFILPVKSGKTFLASQSRRCCVLPERAGRDRHNLGRSRHQSQEARQRAAGPTRATGLDLSAAACSAATRPNLRPRTSGHAESLRSRERTRTVWRSYTRFLDKQSLLAGLSYSERSRVEGVTTRSARLRPMKYTRSAPRAQSLISRTHSLARQSSEHEDNGFPAPPQIQRWEPSEAFAR